MSLVLEVFTRLTVKPSKCHLFQECVHYLGHILSEKEVETDPEKIRCVADWPVPTSPKEFLGLA